MYNSKLKFFFFFCCNLSIHVYKITFGGKTCVHIIKKLCEIVNLSLFSIELLDMNQGNELILSIS